MTNYDKDEIALPETRLYLYGSGVLFRKDIPRLCFQPEAETIMISFMVLSSHL